MGCVSGKLPEKQPLPKDISAIPSSLPKDISTIPASRFDPPALPKAPEMLEHVQPQVLKKVQHIVPHVLEKVEHVQPHAPENAEHVLSHASKKVEHVQPHAHENAEHVQSHAPENAEHVQSHASKKVEHVQPHAHEQSHAAPPDHKHNPYPEIKHDNIHLQIPFDKPAISEVKAVSKVQSGLNLADSLPKEDGNIRGTVEVMASKIESEIQAGRSHVRSGIEKSALHTVHQESEIVNDQNVFNHSTSINLNLNYAIVGA